MKCTILLHSTTGNTRLVARFARAHLESRGHDCLLHDVAKRKPMPKLDDVDLLGVACPTMYFRPTYVMERFVARMPAASATGAHKPAFLLATNAGDTGAHFVMLAEQLLHKDYVALGALAVTFPSNWPPRRAAVSGVAAAQTAAELLAGTVSGTRRYLKLLWPDLGDAKPTAPAQVEAFLDDLQASVERTARAGLPLTVASRKMPRGSKPSTVAGRMMETFMMRRATSIVVERDKCSRCGTCVATCPVDCLTRESDDDFPRAGENCTGCWACFNKCPEGALSGFGAPAGVGRYKGPSQRARELFRA